MSKLVGFYNDVEKNNNTVTKPCKLASNTGSSVKWIESFIYFSNLSSYGPKLYIENKGISQCLQLFICFLS